MKLVYSRKFLGEIEHFSDTIKKKFKRQISYLLKDLRHPSLHAKKYHESLDIWQARVDKDIRFYFSIDSDVYTVLKIKKRPK